MRPGYLERRPRARHSHLFVPLERLDAFERLPLPRGGELLALSSGGGFAAILTTRPLELHPLPDGGASLVQDGPVTDWAVVVGGPTGSFEEFAAWARGFRLVPDGPTLRLVGPRPDADPGSRGSRIPSVWELRRGGRLLRDGAPIPNQHPRFDTPWMRERRFPAILNLNSCRTELRWSAEGGREEVHG